MEAVDKYRGERKEIGTVDDTKDRGRKYRQQWITGDRGKK
jgi:hypothetical protein